MRSTRRASQREARRQVDAGGGFADATFLIGDCEDACRGHGDFVPVPGRMITRCRAARRPGTSIRSTPCSLYFGWQLRQLFIRDKALSSQQALRLALHRWPATSTKPAKIRKSTRYHEVEWLQADAISPRVPSQRPRSTSRSSVIA